jgi:hypothetical protein
VTRNGTTDWREGYRHIRVNDTMEFRTESGGNLSLSAGGFGSMSVEVYADGDDVYRRVQRGNESVYLTGPTMRAGRFSNQAERYVSSYLATDEGDLSRSVSSGRASYIVAATGTPTRLSGNVTDYTAVAFVDSSGFVRSLRVSYEFTAGGTTRRVEFGFNYRRVGTANVTPPAWYPEARNATDVGSTA